MEKRKRNGQFAATSPVTGKKKKSMVQLVSKFHHCLVHTLIDLYLNDGHELHSKFFYIPNCVMMISVTKENKRFLQEAFSIHGDCPYHLILDGVANRLGITSKMNYNVPEQQDLL